MFPNKILVNSIFYEDFGNGYKKHQDVNGRVVTFLLKLYLFCNLSLFCFWNQTLDGKPGLCWGAAPGAAGTVRNECEQLRGWKIPLLGSAQRLPALKLCLLQGFLILVLRVLLAICASSRDFCYLTESNESQCTAGTVVMIIMTVYCLQKRMTPSCCNCLCSENDTSGDHTYPDTCIWNNINININNI